VNSALQEALNEQIQQVDARVSSGAGAYRAEADEVRRAADAVETLQRRLGLREFVRNLHPGRGKPQLLLVFRHPKRGPVVLKVYGKPRPNEAAVQGLWWIAGVATVEIAEAADEPVSWLLMPFVKGDEPVGDGLALTPEVAAIMATAHPVYRADVGVPRNLSNGIGVHLHNCLQAAANHRYQIPAGIDELATALLSSGTATFLHGDLTPRNLLRARDGSLRVLDTCGYTGSAEFDAARWCARVGGSQRAVGALEEWLRAEPELDVNLARRLLGLELLMEAGVREIVKDEQGRSWKVRDTETLACLVTGSDLLGVR
jgi:hypothetical protein